MNTKLMKNMKKKKGFTLVELIIVIAIIAILAAMAIPKFGAVILDSKVSTDIAVAKNIQSTASILVANGTYANDEGAVAVTDNEDITSRIDGDTVPKAYSDGEFTINIEDGNVTVSANSVQLAPILDNSVSEYTANCKG